MTKKEKTRELKRNNEKYVREQNAKIIPDIPGTVRTEGPRRQFHGEVAHDGRIIWTEI